MKMSDLMEEVQIKSLKAEARHCVVYPSLTLKTESSLKIMCANRRNACKHDCLQGARLYFLFSAFLVLHQLTSRC